MPDQTFFNIIGFLRRLKQEYGDAATMQQALDLCREVGRKYGGVGPEDVMELCNTDDWRKAFVMYLHHTGPFKEGSEGTIPTQAETPEPGGIGQQPVSDSKETISTNGKDDTDKIVKSKTPRPYNKKKQIRMSFNSLQEIIDIFVDVCRKYGIVKLSKKATGERVSTRELTIRYSSELPHYSTVLKYFNPVSAFTDAVNKALAEHSGDALRASEPLQNDARGVTASVNIIDGTNDNANNTNNDVDVIPTSNAIDVVIQISGLAKSPIEIKLKIPSPNPQLS